MESENNTDVFLDYLQKAAAITFSAIEYAKKETLEQQLTKAQSSR
jgi:hypothetical protein